MRSLITLGLIAILSLAGPSMALNAVETVDPSDAPTPGKTLEPSTLITSTRAAAPSTPTSVSKSEWSRTFTYSWEVGYSPDPSFPTLRSTSTSKYSFASSDLTNAPWQTPGTEHTPCDTTLQLRCGQPGGCSAKLDSCVMCGYCHNS